MARNVYAATPADYVIDGATGLPKSGVVVTIYDSRTSGSQVTDLQNMSNVGQSTVTTNAQGGFRFQGPDGEDNVLWAQPAGDSNRYAIYPVANTGTPYAKPSHNHDGTYSTTGHSHGAYSLTSHNHDGTYSASAHTHAGVYSTTGHTHADYSATSHNHDGAYLTTGTGDARYSVLGHSHSGLSNLGRTGMVTVASSTAPQGVRDGCDFQCDGTDDQVQINAALLKASRINDGFTGEGLIGVQLVGDQFNIGNNGGSITMYPSTFLRGNGPGTLLTPQFGAGSDSGCIELINANAHRVQVRDLTIAKTNATNFNGHGIKWLMNAAGSVYEIVTGSDSYMQIYNVTICRAAGKGIWVGGPGGANGARETQIRDCYITNTVGEGIHIDGASDSKIFDCVVSGVKGRAAGFLIEGGNTKVGGCKAFFRGNETGGSAESGFVLSSSRLTVSNCEAQDNGGWGFVISSADATISGCNADSNGARSSTTSSTTGGGGFYISGNGVYSGIHAYNRPQNAIEQVNGIVVASTPHVYMTGRVSVPSGSAHVIDTGGTDVTSGDFATNSYVRIARDGDTVLAIG